jgi:hypothetical protein
MECVSEMPTRTKRIQREMIEKCDGVYASHARECEYAHRRHSPM